MFACWEKISCVAVTLEDTQKMFTFMLKKGIAEKKNCSPPAPRDIMICPLEIRGTYGCYLRVIILSSCLLPKREVLS